VRFEAKEYIFYARPARFIGNRAPQSSSFKLSPTVIMNGLDKSNNESSRGIPMRRVAVEDPSHMPSHYSETPGGTMFSTTPGGTRIIYERKFLLDLKNSPLSKTPTSLPVIPGITLDDDGKVIEEVHKKAKKGNENQVPLEEHNGHDPKKAHDDIQFSMDM